MRLNCGNGCAETDVKTSHPVDGLQDPLFGLFSATSIRKPRIFANDVSQLKNNSPIKRSIRLVWLLCSPVAKCPSGWADQVSGSNRRVEGIRRLNGICWNCHQPIRSSLDNEFRVIPAGFIPMSLGFSNISLHSSLDRLQKALQLGFFSLGNQIYGSIRQILDVSLHIKISGDSWYLVSESDSLNLPGKVDS